MLHQAPAHEWQAAASSSSWRHAQTPPQRPGADRPTWTAPAANTADDQETAESPSVRDLLANFEKGGGRAPAAPPKSGAVARTKMLELRGNYHSHENLHTDSGSDSGKRSRSSSKENVFEGGATPTASSRYERLSSSPLHSRSKRSHSTENIIDSVPIARELTSPLQPSGRRDAPAAATPPAAAGVERAPAVPDSAHRGGAAAGTTSSSPSAIKYDTHSPPATTTPSSERNLRADDAASRAVSKQTSPEQTPKTRHKSDKKSSGRSKQASPESVHNTNNQDVAKPQKKKSKRSRSPKVKSPATNDVTPTQSPPSRGTTASEQQTPVQTSQTTHSAEQDLSVASASPAAASPSAAAQSTTDYITDLLDSRINVRRDSKPSTETPTTTTKKKPDSLPNNNESPNRCVRAHL